MPVDEKYPWWKETVVYQIYPRSFADSNGDGIGDLEGIRQKLDYLVDLGVETLWISPFYESPQADFGYDISDYRKIAPEYGDMALVERLINEAHEKGLKIVLDMVMNHTSDQHPWFRASKQSKNDPKRDWYIWKEGRGKKPPNNWNAMIGGCGWHYDETTEQWYWAQFLPFQPDLNYRNPEVKAEMLDTLRFWMDKGVDGFRLDIVNALFEDAEFRDNPFKWTLLPSDDDPTMAFQGSDNTLNHPDTLAFMKTLRALVDGHDEKERFLVGEVNAPMEQARAHCGDRADGLHLVFLFASLSTKLKACKMQALMQRYEQLFPEPYCPTWVFGNHDRARRISRIGDTIEMGKLNAFWQLTARGVPFLYNGEEIGMKQFRMPVKDSLDPVARRLAWLPQFVFDFVWKTTGESVNRDECRTPMQWSNAPNAGFCPANVQPWLPTPTDTQGRDVETQRNDPDSLFSCYRRLLHLRRAHEALRRGSQTILDTDALCDKGVLGYLRETDKERLLLLLNTNEKATSLRLPDEEFNRVLLSTRAKRSESIEERGTIELAALEGVCLTAKG